MLEISAKKGLCDVICGSDVKTWDLAAHFRFHWDYVSNFLPQNIA